jgi:hypothetical protein
VWHEKDAKPPQHTPKSILNECKFQIEKSASENVAHPASNSWFDGRYFSSLLG